MQEKWLNNVLQHNVHQNRELPNLLNVKSWWKFANYTLKKIYNYNIYLRERV